MLLPLAAEVREAVGFLANSVWQMAWSGGLFVLAVGALVFLFGFVLGSVFSKIEDLIGADGWMVLGYTLIAFIAFGFYQFTPWGFYLGETFLDGARSFKVATEQF